MTEETKEGLKPTSEIGEKRLIIRKEAEEIQRAYKEDPRAKTFNAIVYGGLGTGKTSLLKTCRKPLHVDSFDPGGTKVLDGEEGIYNDIKWEVEDPYRPTVAVDWDRKFHQRRKMGYFESLGTYALDSTTTWAQDIMYEIMKKAGRAGGVPYQQDWLPQMTVIENAMRYFLALPCDCILICHDDYDKDEATGRMFVHPMLTGKLKRRIPLLFDELYYAQTKETAKGLEYQLLTRNTGLYQARTRLGKGGELSMYEEPNIKKILAKVGLDTSDKPLL